MYFNPITPNSNQNYIPKFKDAGGYPKHQVFFGMSPIYGVGNTIAMSSSPYALSSAGTTVAASSSQPWWQTALRYLGRNFRPYSNTRLQRMARAGSNNWGSDAIGNPGRMLQLAPQESFDPTRRPDYNPTEGLTDGQKERYFSVMYGYGDPYSGVPLDQIPEDYRFPSEYTSGAGWIDLIRGNEFFSSLPEIPIITDSKLTEWLKETFDEPPGIKRYGINPETGKFGHYYDQSITPAEYLALQPVEGLIKYRIAPNQQLQLDMATVDTKEYMGIFDEQGNLYQVPYNDAYLNDESLTTQERADMKKEFLKSGTLIDLENTPSNELPKLFNYEDIGKSLPKNMREYVYSPENNNWTIAHKETLIPYATLSNAEFKEMYPSVDTTLTSQYGGHMKERGTTVSYSHDMLEELSNQAKPGEQISVQEMLFNQRNERRKRENREFK